MLNESYIGKRLLSVPRLYPPPAAGRPGHRTEGRGCRPWEQCRTQKNPSETWPLEKKKKSPCIYASLCAQQGPDALYKMQQMEDNLTVTLAALRK